MVVPCPRWIYQFNTYCVLLFVGVYNEIISIAYLMNSILETVILVGNIKICAMSKSSFKSIWSICLSSLQEYGFSLVQWTRDFVMVIYTKWELFFLLGTCKNWPIFNWHQMLFSYLQIVFANLSALKFCRFSELHFLGFKNKVSW